VSKKLTKIDIFDTTLRDGEQSPGVNLGIEEKLEIARQLAFLGVDIIEAGFPITSPGDAAAVKKIAGTVRGATICALARAVEKDMDVALDSLKPARRKRLHVFLATSAIHRKYKLHKAKDEIERLSVWAVKYARKRIGEVEFSPEDASRTERDFLFRIIEKTMDCKYYHKGAGNCDILYRISFLFRSYLWSAAALWRDNNTNGAQYRNCIFYYRAGAFCQ